MPPSSAPTNHLHHHHLHTLKPINNSVAPDQTASHTYNTPITMADREQPYDPYIPSGGAGGQQAAGGQNGNMRTAALQAVRSHRITPALQSDMAAFLAAC